MLTHLLHGILAFFAAAVLAGLLHLLLRNRAAPKEPSASLASYLPPEPESYGAFRAKQAAVPSAVDKVQRPTELPASERTARRTGT